MRFMERVASAIRYHKRVYLGEFLLTAVFCLASLALWTIRHANADMRQGFINRLEQLTTDGHAASGPVVQAVKAGYATLDTRYTLTWLVVVAINLLLCLVFGWWSVRHRRAESEAYLILGKSTWSIAAQYVAESLAVFIAAFLLIALATFLLSDSLNHLLVNQSRNALTAEFSRSVSNTTANQSLRTLFEHKLTEFTGPGLFFPGPPPNEPQPPHQLFGIIPTALVGCGTIIGGQGLAALAELSVIKHRLLHTVSSPNQTHS